MWAKTKDQHEIVMKTLPNQRLARGECYNVGKVFMFPLWAVWLGNWPLVLQNYYT